jgi:hypothetical protein
MTPYIQQQLKKLCDNPNWYDDMLISWDKTQEIKGKIPGIFRGTRTH